mgnify:FL=1|jgi:Protein of unknown function (DUF3139).
MRKNIIIGLGIGFFLIVLSPLFLMAYLKVQLYILEKETYQYLTREMGYEEADILTVEAKLKKLSLFTAEVVFADEPQVICDYKRNGDGHMVQIGASLSKNEDRDIYEYKHLDRRQRGSAAAHR